MPEARRYSENEVAEILRLVSEHRTLGPDSSQGMTLEEIKSVTAELGLDLTAVEAAARRVDAGHSETYVDGSQVEFTRAYNGEVSDEAWEEMVALLRRRTGSQGEVTSRGITREWSAAGEIVQTHLTATTANGVTRVRISTNIAGYYVFSGILSAMAALPFLMITAIATKKGGVDPIMATSFFFLALLAIVFVAFRKGRARRGRALKFVQLLDEFTPLIESSPALSPVPERQVEEDQLHLYQ